MTTYAESQGQAPFDWNKFLETVAPESSEWEAASELSRRWVTCACGNQCSEIPRVVNRGFLTGCPIDPRLSELGIEFHDAILSRNKVFAKTVLAQIETRSAEILAEMKGK